MAADQKRKLEDRIGPESSVDIKSEVIAMAEESVVRGEISMSGKAGEKPAAFAGKRT